MPTAEDYINLSLGDLADRIEGDYPAVGGTDEVRRMAELLVGVLRFHGGHSDGRQAAIYELRRISTALSRAALLLEGVDAEVDW